MAFFRKRKIKDQESRHDIEETKVFEDWRGHEEDIQEDWSYQNGLETDVRGEFSHSINKDWEYQDSNHDDNWPYSDSDNSSDLYSSGDLQRYEHENWSYQDRVENTDWPHNETAYGQKGDSYQDEVAPSRSGHLPKRAKIDAKMDRFLTNGIIIVSVLLFAVLLIAFLV